ncbi:ribosome assembly cofactor RimP [Halpernia frigidisoli]|uniref:Ribosome maturation factor RimP n=1 Tax=Halpernia frigidisoli TaxID=1125876 RepID=A0A1I3GKL9_9FLAO|nr:ribosome assembly cofactor RimP [Halpernia frigidisoli]SFI24026.1 ribosome maturation factor RimP [Halpernia frigidisoli]
MSFKEKVAGLINDFLAEREDLFLIETKITSAQDITVILDGDNGVTLQDCLDASRAIEFNLEEDEDFSLQVMSAGLSEPLETPRQFRKNIEREIEVWLNNDEEIAGELMDVSDTDITLKLEYRRPKLIGKGKEDVVEERKISYTDIKKALVVVKF